MIMAMAIPDDVAVIDVSLTHQEVSEAIAAYCREAGVRYCLGPWSMQVFLPACGQQQKALFAFLSSIKAEYNLPLFGVEACHS